MYSINTIILKQDKLFSVRQWSSSCCQVQIGCCFEFTEKQNKGLYLNECSYVNHKGLCSCYNKLVHTSYGMRSENNVRKNINNHHLVEKAIEYLTYSIFICNSYKPIPIKFLIKYGFKIALLTLF